MLRIAIQKSGRLHDDSINLIKECGIKINKGMKQLKSAAYNFPIELLFLRDDDIPGYVEDGVADIGIVGENELLEKQKTVQTLRPLGFSKCRLSIAVPRNTEYKSTDWLRGKEIATSYPNVLSKYLSENNIEASVHEISGSVEIAPGIGLTDAICDLVSTGSTLLSNGLKEVQTILNSQAVLIGNTSLDDEKTSLINELVFRIDAVRRAENTKYIQLNTPNESIDKIVDLLPGVKSPTIMPLKIEGWSSLHSVVNENDFWDIIEKLKEVGAEGILVSPIEKIID